jgi:anti-anti-sigma factor
VGEHLSLSTSKQDDDGSWVVRVTGELDMLTAPELTSCLAGFDGANLTVDLSNLSFLDSRGIAALVEAHARLEEHGARRYETMPMRLEVTPRTDARAGP